MRLRPATWWFRRKVLALPVWWQRQHAEMQTARLRSSGCTAGREILYARWQSAVSDKLTCWRSICRKGIAEAAALEGGVGGNAGLFSNARDLSIIGQMLLNKGTWKFNRRFH